MNKIDPNADLACSLIYSDTLEKFADINNLSLGHVMTFGINILKTGFNICESDVEEFAKDLAPILNKWIDKI